jgi:Cu/Ag efflux protein CusF
MSKTSLVSVSIAAVLIAAPLYAADAKPRTESGSVTVSTTIEAIDHAARTVTLKGKDGNYETLTAGPEIKRFDELKVGDKVTFKYTESVAVRIRKPGDPVTAASNGEPAIVRGATAKPSGTMTQQITANVVVKAVDPKSKSITFMGEDGHSISVRVDDKGLVKDVHPGDKIEVTYTAALLISVE